MAIDLDFVGRSGEPVKNTWTTRDTLLYAIAVGAGQGDASRELAFTTENSEVAHRVLPSFICVASRGKNPDGFSVDMTKMLHADMSFELFQDVPAEGHTSSTSTITGIFDKGSGALVRTTTEVTDAVTGVPVGRLISGQFVRGEGGFGGDRGPRDEWTVPDREPDETVHYETRPEQALIYRLTGDRNPLHSDPAFAVRSGFAAPILHGMCTYGFTARALLHAVAGSDPSKFGSMYGRFSKTVQLGESLDVQVWRTDAGAVFRTLDSHGDVVIDRGRFTFRESA
ncbi:3-alpha,7-alpha, 12-alpha-trihydroxy-5-beta-cholest-24-enoyl-CoAhydratase [Microbacterium sp. HM58-2]|nr:3-alpha,7-alpha, 12-alpha-trihydroxy-5-beta-cholest-24-enoyl-CoAhydratase [Microbacterium sp. HM58-2]